MKKSRITKEYCQLKVAEFLNDGGEIQKIMCQHDSGWEPDKETSVNFVDEELIGIANQPRINSLKMI